MSGLLNSSLNGSTTNLQESTGRHFATQFSSQSATAPSFHHSVGIQGLHPIHGSFNVPHIPSSLVSRNAAGSSVQSSGVQQPGASISNGRLAPNNLPVAIPQISHGSSRGHSAVINRGGMNVAGSPTFSNSMYGVAPHLLGMLGNSCPTSGGSQSQLQAGNNLLNHMGMLNDVRSNNSSLFDMNEFPQLTGRPSSVGGPQGQLGSLRKQGTGVSSIVQQNQEFSIQNEDFPALPGFKGVSSDFPTDLHQKEQLHENPAILQSQHFSLERSAGFNLGGNYPSTRQQQQQQQQRATSMSGAGVSFGPGNNQDLLRFNGSDLFPYSHEMYHAQIQSNGHSGFGLRPSPNPASFAYDQLNQQYQHPQDQSQFLIQPSYRDEGTRSSPDQYGLLALSNITKTKDPDLKSLALGIDLRTLGLNLSSPDKLYKGFGSPWADEPAKGEPEYSIPACYNAQRPPPLQQGHIAKLNTLTLLYVFYSMPKDLAQIYAACELYSRGWFYHKENKFWFTRAASMDPSVKTNTYERGSYHCFDPNTGGVIRKDNFVVQFEAVEKLPIVPSALQETFYLK